MIIFPNEWKLVYPLWIWHWWLTSRSPCNVKKRKSNVPSAQLCAGKMPKSDVNVWTNCMQFIYDDFLHSTQTSLLFVKRHWNISWAQKWSGHHLYCCSTGLSFAFHFWRAEVSQSPPPEIFLSHFTLLSNSQVFLSYPSYTPKHVLSPAEHPDEQWALNLHSFNFVQTSLVLASFPPSVLWLF